MPAAKLILDFDTRKFSDDSGAQLLSLTGKKGSVREYELSVLQNGVAMSLPAGTTAKVALKKTPDPAGTLLVQADAARSGWGTGSSWFFTLDMTGNSFDAVIGQNVDFEVLLELPDGQHIPSVTLPFAVQANVMVPT